MGLIEKNFLVFNRWLEESDMDAEDLAKAALKGIENWLDEEIVGFLPNLVESAYYCIIRWLFIFLQFFFFVLLKLPLQFIFTVFIPDFKWAVLFASFKIHL